MKTVLSYCLFDPIHHHAHRTWDEHRNDDKRYWFNLPALYIVNKILYPSYEMKFHVNDSLLYNPLFVLLKSLDVVIDEIKIPFTKTSEPMLWRMIPIWEDYDCVFSRDIDSIPNRNEFRSTVYFEKSNHSIQTIRSHENHYHEMGCDMLGGLSGFKSKLIQRKPKTFDDYYSSRDNIPWAQDQFLMVNTFLVSQDRAYLETNFLDCPIDNQNRKSVFMHSTMPSDFQVETTNVQEEVLSLVDSYSISTWAGEPSDTRGEFLQKLLELNTTDSNRVKEVLSKNSYLREFYGVDL